MKKIKVLIGTLCLLLVVTTVVLPTTALAEPDPQSQQPATGGGTSAPDIAWILFLLSLIRL